MVSLALAALTVGRATTLDARLSAVGVSSSNDVVEPCPNGGGRVLTLSIFVGGAALLAETNVVLLTELAPLGARNRDLLASFMDDLEVMLAEAE